MMKITIMERHPPPNFCAPHPAAIPRSNLLIFAPIHYDTFKRSEQHLGPLQKTAAMLMLDKLIAIY